DFKSPSRVLEPTQRWNDFFKRNPQLHCQSYYPNRIADVMATRNVQASFPQSFTATNDSERRSEVAQFDVDPPIICRRIKTKRDATWTGSANSARMRIIRTIKECAGSLGDELLKDLLDCGEVGIIIEMFFFDV